MDKIKLITTNSYFNIFSLLCRELEGKTSIEQKNLIFVEEKGSLMTESVICSAFGGAFNTEVYSFGNFLRLKRGEDKVLSKEGSSMVIKKLLENLTLTLLNRGKDASSTVYELIALLKSANVTISDIEYASENCKGILKTKLKDIAIIFSAYENYLKEKGLTDQSSFLSLLPDLIDNLDEIKNANIYVIGYSGLTSQNLNAIENFIKRAKSFTAILPYGDNEVAFVNETAKKVKNLCKALGVKVDYYYEKTPYSIEGESISSSLFNPAKAGKKISTDKIHLLTAKEKDEEAEHVASIIKREVLNGKRYKDFTVILPEINDNEHIKKAFDLLQVPYYVDTNYNIENHPIITLILSYVDCLIKKGDRERILSLIKNPFYSADKELNDAFINYVYKYNINYSEFFKPFTYLTKDKEEFYRIENLRKNIESDLSSFNVLAFLEKLKVEEKAIEYAKTLRELGCFPEGALTEQLYSKVLHVIEEMQSILGDVSDKKEFKKIFVSGISALKLSILPQYNDAVFIGGFKECARAKCKNLFVCSLTSSVPGVTGDTALLSDNEIDTLYNIKVIVEPKVKIINHRIREEIAVALSSFTEKLYLSYSVSDISGKKQEKSEIISFFERTFTLLEFPKKERFLSEKQALKNFAKGVANFREWKTADIKEEIAYLSVTKEDKAKKVLSSANTEIVKRIENTNVLMDFNISPTSIEEFYKCPYRFFISRTLGVREREEGEVSSNEMGTLMHDVFYNFIKGIDGVDSDEKAKLLFNSCKERVLNDEKYQKYLTSALTENAVVSALEECEKHCNNLYEFFNNSNFKTKENDLEKNASLSILDGEVTLSGKIDRVDTFDDYYRVIDYKTGKAEDDDGELFTGVKLQLWLYSLAIRDKKLAGVYYYDAKNNYRGIDKKVTPILKGKTLKDERVIELQDNKVLSEGKSKFLPVTIKDGMIAGAVSEETLSAYQKYATIMCENAVNEMKKGTIIPSAYEGTCSYCKYKSICLSSKEKERSKVSVKEEEIVSAVNGGEDNA